MRFQKKTPDTSCVGAKILLTVQYAFGANGKTVGHLSLKYYLADSNGIISALWAPTTDIRLYIHYIPRNGFCQGVKGLKL
jgi:hypothetical protein